MIRKKIPKSRLRVNNSSLVRVGNDYITMALKIGREKKVNSVGKIIEEAIVFYKNSNMPA